MSVHQLKDGRWLVRYRKGKNPDRPNSTATYFGRGDEAQKAAEEFNLSLGLGSRKRKVAGRLFIELVNEYQEAKQYTMAASTFENLCIKMEAVILPEIGSCMAARITPARLDRYVASRSSSGVKNTTIHRELSDIRAVLRWAVKRKLIATNPMDGFEMPKRDDARIQPPTKKEFEAIIACAAPHLQRAMLLSYYTGLRPGKEELLSLKWEAVDFINRTIMVTSAKKGGLPVRMVPLNNTLYNYLLKWHNKDSETGQQYIVNYGGGRVDSLKTAWRSAKKRAKVFRRLRLYDIRHRAITNMLEAGADLKSVSEIAGHASVDMTTRIYQHVSSDLKRKAVDFLD